MLPSITAEDAHVVTHLQDASRHVRGKSCPLLYPASTFDAGGLTSVGIPTVMFGASGGQGGVLGEDYVCIREVVEEAKMLLHVILTRLA